MLGFTPHPQLYVVSFWLFLAWNLVVLSDTAAHLVITNVPPLELGLIYRDILSSFVADKKYDILYSLRNQLFHRSPQNQGQLCVWSCRLYLPGVSDAI